MSFGAKRLANTCEEVLDSIAVLSDEKSCGLVWRFWASGPNLMMLCTAGCTSSQRRLSPVYATFQLDALHEASMQDSAHLSLKILVAKEGLPLQVLALV